MARGDYKRCKQCGRHADVVGPISHTRLCGDCAYVLLVENIDGIHTKSGMPWARWKLGTVTAALGNPTLVNALIDAGAFDYQEGHVRC